MIEPLIKLLDQKDDSVESTDKIFKKLIYLINCIVISIWVASKFGYKISTEPFTIDTIKELFSEYTILLGLLLYLFVNRMVKFIVYTLNHLMKPVVVWVALHPILTNWNSTFKNEVLKFLKSIITKPEDWIDKDFTETITHLNTNLIETSLVTYAIFTSFLSYVLIVRESFPSLYFLWFAVVIFLIFLHSLFGYSMISKVYNIVLTKTYPRE